MNKCYFCYEPTSLDLSYHAKCCKKFFGTAQLPELDLDEEILSELARETVNNRIAITGVQPKLSVNLETIKSKNRLTIVGLLGNYILKPQSPKRPAMPEVEDLTMHLAQHFKINTCDHALIPTTNGEMAYIAKRFDRVNGKKIHVEDLCQVGGFQTEQKYDSSYERCGKLIATYATNTQLEVINYFELLVFSFLSGNNDMHMKNFSLLHSGNDNKISLSPAYDLINAKLINPKDQGDTALLLNERKKKISFKDFEKLSASLGIRENVVTRIIKKFSVATPSVNLLIEKSFLNENHKSEYKKFWAERLERLNNV